MNPHTKRAHISYLGARGTSARYGVGVILIIFFYFLALLQTSFLVHFPALGVFSNLILITVILINLFTPPHSWWGVSAAFIGGFFLDIFSEGFWGINFFGFHILILVGLSLFIKFVFKKYVRPVIRLGSPVG